MLILTFFPPFLQPAMQANFEANAVCSQILQALKKFCTVGIFFVEFSGITNCILNMTSAMPVMLYNLLQLIATAVLHFLMFELFIKLK